MNTYEEGYKRRYLAKGGTYQQLFCVFVWYLIVALPFYFSFGGDKFWQKPKNQMLACEYNFTGYYAVQVSYVQNNAFSTQEYSNIVGSSMGSITGLSSLIVSDSRYQSTASFSLVNYSNKQLQNLNVILYYDVWIEDLGKKISVAYVHNFNGDLAFVQTLALVRYEPQTQLNDIDNRINLNYPAYMPNFQPPASFDSLMDHIIENHHVHRLNQQFTQTSVESQNTATREFKIKLLKDNKVNIPYFPSVLETLKFAFSKWLAFAIIAYFVFNKLLEKLVKDGALVAKVSDEIIP